MPQEPSFWDMFKKKGNKKNKLAEALVRGGEKKAKTVKKRNDTVEDYMKLINE